MVFYDPPVLLFGLVAVLSATLCGIAALWAAVGWADWFWRAGPLVLLLAAMAPIGAYEPLVMFAVQSALVIGGISAVRLIGRWRSARRARDDAGPAEVTSRPRATLRFGLVDVLKIVVLLAAIFALVRLAEVVDVWTLWNSTAWGEWLARGIGLAAVTLGAAYLVLGTARLYARAIACALLTGSGGALHMLSQAMSTVAAFRVGDPWSPAWSFVLAALQGFLTVVVLQLAEVAATTGRRGNIRVASARAGLVGFLLLGVVALGDFYWALLPAVLKPKPPLPSPNGYEEIARIGRTFNWTAVPTQDVETASIQACQTFATDNADQLTRLRKAFPLPSRVPMAFDEMHAGSLLPSIQTYREINRALAIEAKGAGGAGRSSDAMRSYLDCLHLARPAAHGGLSGQEMVGSSIEGVGIAGLITQFEKLDAEDLETVIHELEAHDRSREPVAAIVQRERLWFSEAVGWFGRLYLWSERATGDGGVAEPIAFGRARADVQLRLTLAEAAVRRYSVLEGSLPESLEALVPEYLSAVPQDPFGGGPLIYRRTPEGYLLYSVGANGTDDGGRRVSLTAAIFEEVGDIFFDAKWDAP